jgi:hypothetical protein
MEITRVNDLVEAEALGHDQRPALREEHLECGEPWLRCRDLHDDVGAQIARLTRFRHDPTHISVGIRCPLDGDEPELTT